MSTAVLPTVEIGTLRRAPLMYCPTCRRRRLAMWYYAGHATRTVRERTYRAALWEAECPECGLPLGHRVEELLGEEKEEVTL